MQSCELPLRQAILHRRYNQMRMSRSLHRNAFIRLHGRRSCAITSIRDGGRGKEGQEFGYFSLRTLFYNVMEQDHVDPPGYLHGSVVTLIQARFDAEAVVMQ